MSIEYIFCINTGRSGSQYLSELFRHITNTASYHEPLPVMNGRNMRLYLRNKKNRLQAAMPEKIEKIEQLKGDKEIYIETNQCFIRGFGWEIFKYIPQEKVGIIILKRDKEAVLNSYIKANVSPITPNGWQWINNPFSDFLYLTPSPEIKRRLKFALNKFWNTVVWYLWRYKVIRKTSTFRPKALLDYEKKLLRWYLDEHEYRAQAYKEKFPELKYYEVTIDQLNDYEEVIKMKDFFLEGMAPLESLKDAVGKKKNTHKDLVSLILAETPVDFDTKVDYEQ